MDFMNTILGLMNSEFIMSCICMAILLGIIIHLNNIINEKNDIIADYENQLRENAEYIRDIQDENTRLKLKNAYDANSIDSDVVEQALSDQKRFNDEKINQYEDIIAKQNIAIQDLQRRIENRKSYQSQSTHINQVAKSGDGSYTVQIGELNVVNKREHRAPSSGSAILDMMASTHRLIDEANDKKSEHQKYKEMVNGILSDNK